MAYAVPMNQPSFHPLPVPGSGERGLTWPLAGSIAVHVVVLAALISIRVAPTIEQPFDPYHVDLVTLAEIRAAPARERLPAVPPREPERITDSLVGSLESVIVPAPQEIEVARQVVPVSPTPPQRPRALELAAPQVQAPPQPPQLASDSPGIQTTPRSSITKVAPLAQTLKHAVGTIVMPKMERAMRQESSAPESVNPRPNRVQKKDLTRAPEPSGVTLPSQVPQLAMVAPLSQKDEAPVSSQKNSWVAASVKRTIRSVRIPEFRNPPVASAASKEVPLIPGLLRNHATETETRERVPVVVPPQAPTLARIQVAKEPDTSRPTDPLTPSTSDHDTIASLPIPELKSFGAHQLDSRQTKSGTRKTLTNLHVAESSSEMDAYVNQVRRKIDQQWIALLPVEVQQQEMLRVVLAFRVEQTGQVKEQMLTVVQTSGNADFDSGAKRAVAAASPLPPFPPTMTAPYQDFEFRFAVRPKQ